MRAPRAQRRPAPRPPGPVNIHERVLRAMSVPGQNHRDPWFAAWWKEILEDSKIIYNTTEGTPFIFSGTGTGGWEAALTNTLSPGDKVLTFRYGQFSHLWVDMMQRLGLDVEVHDRPWGEGACEKTVEEVLSKDRAHKIKAVCVVHNETTTGVTSDIGGVRAAMDKAGHPAMLMVDGVSSIGALDFQFDKVCGACGGGAGWWAGTGRGGDLDSWAKGRVGEGRRPAPRGSPATHAGDAALPACKGFPS
jgi:alanine-glyoxylate transaminase/serine-glyoxylate transaminase/serine-pyruvate transaminase